MRIDLAPFGACRSGLFYQELNAAARTAAEILLDSGQPVVFAYPDEERIQRAPEP